VLSAQFDLPPGAVIVWTLTVTALASAPLFGHWREAAPAEQLTPH